MPLLRKDLVGQWGFAPLDPPTQAPGKKDLSTFLFPFGLVLVFRKTVPLSFFDVIGKRS